MGPLGPLLSCVVLACVAVGVSTQDCDHNGATYKDDQYFLSNQCDVMYKCIKGDVAEVGAQWGCPSYAHCDNGICKCNDKYAPASHNYGMIATCKRVDFSCDDPNGIKREQDERWTSQDCSTLYQCFHGQIFPITKGYKCFSNSQCINGDCVCNDGYKKIVTDKFQYCERTNFDCTFQGQVIKDQEATMTADCSKYASCFNGQLNVEDASCSENMECVDAKCQCKPKYRPSSFNDKGRVFSCSRYDFTCEEDGVTHNNFARWFDDDCTNENYCNRGVIQKSPKGCPSNGHCTSGMCYCDEGFKALTLSSGVLYGCKRIRYDIDCAQYLYEAFGMCLKHQSGSRTFDESRDFCTFYKSIMMIPDRPHLRLKQLSIFSFYSTGLFFIKASPIFDDISAIPINDKTKLDREFIADMIQAHNIPTNQAVAAFRRFSPKATVEELNADTPLKSLCLALDFTPGSKGLKLINCHEKHGVICQQEITIEEKETEFTDWYDLDKNVDDGNEESSNKIVDAFKKGTLPDARLCRDPVSMQCREVGTNKLYSKSNTHGVALRKACEDLAITCKNEDQPEGQKCPNLEIRFECITDPTNDCAVDAKRTECESKGQECVMGVYGAFCMTRRSKRTGYEKVGVSECTVDSLKHAVHTCSVQGSRYTTFDTVKYDFHGKCSYVLSSTVENYTPTNTFPAFSIVENHLTDPDGNDNTVAFDLTLNSVRYSFNGDYFFITKGANTVQANPIGYNDDSISVFGRRGPGHIKYTIDTNFCLTISFDQDSGLHISLPASYSLRVNGMCGDFDGREGDLRLPQELETTTPEVLGDYFLVNSGTTKGKCAPQEVTPQVCDKTDINKFKGKKYCGVFNHQTSSPVAKAILDLSKDQVKEYNRKQLNKLFQDCIKANCKNQTEIYRCRNLDERMEDLITIMNLDARDFDSTWRTYVECENNPSSMCNGIPNTEYQEKYKPNCQDSCFSKDRSAQCSDPKERPGCPCKDGFFLDSRLRCVPDSECQKTCKLLLAGGEAIELNNGDTFVVQPCNKIVKCVDGETKESNIGPCSEFAECTDFGHKCACRKGFTGDGKTCNSVKRCKFGYHAIGDKCYKLGLPKLDWHTAAINCGMDGAQLARYDSEIDVDLTLYLNKVPELFLKSIEKRVRRLCYSGKRCTPERNAYITSIEVANAQDPANCKNKFHVSSDRKSILVTGKCRATFIIGYVNYNYAKSLRLEDFEFWVGGNTEVMGQWNQNSNTHFQVDPPRMVAPGTFNNEMGCFMASLNLESFTYLRPIPECDKLKFSICEYDNTEENPYDPSDFKGINKKVIYQEAISLCEAEGRPLVSISNENQARKVRGILSQLGGLGWLGARYRNSSGEFVWPGNQPVLYSNWAQYEPDHYIDEFGGDLRELCVSMTPQTGTWASSECTRKLYPVCGPPEGNKPTVFTSFFPTSKPSSLPELKEKIRKSGIKDYVCVQPIAIECTAREVNNGQWVTNKDDNSGSLKCSMGAFSCVDNGVLDCSTFQVRFLCPLDENHCESLKAMGLNPCGQQICRPVRNHYICRCPPGRKWNTQSKECTRPCGECIARGDPHYETLNGLKYSFQGQCKYKFGGICEKDRDQSSPSFDVLTQNVACGDRGAACLKSVEIRLFNMPVKRDGITEKVDFVIIVAEKSEKFTVNGVAHLSNQFSVYPAFQVNRRKNYFYFASPVLDITILYSGSSIKLTVPEKFHDKMCGLCGQCGKHELKYANGTLVTYEINSRGKINEKNVIEFANDYLVRDPNIDIEECKTVNVDECAEEKLTELEQPDKCGILKDNAGSLKDCFSVVNPDNYFEDCTFDACRENTQEAICNIIKSYAQACIQKGVTLDWRRDNFCPYDCSEEKEYQSDASCAPTCGQSAAAREQCNEDPEEGCVCPRGQMRLGEKCVEPDECGCLLILNNGRKEVLLPPGESMLMPECTEKVKCEINDKGEAKTVTEPFSLGANAICVPSIPPIIECRKGYILINGVTCEEDPSICKDDYKKRADMCVDPQPEDRIWRQAIEACNEKDGTLVKVENEVELGEIAKLIRENSFDSAYISGQVKAVVSGSNTVTFSPVLTEEQQEMIEYINFAFNKFLLPLISLSKKVDASKVNDGDVFALLVTVQGDDKVFVTAVPRETGSNFICEERKPKNNETDWFGPCNTDEYMADDGDRETKMSLMMDPECLVCSKPKDVRCRPVNGDGTVTGTCQITNTGTYYSCSEGSNCIDNQVELKCTKDVDECEKELDDCTGRMNCINTVGAYKCQCKEEYPLMVDGKCESELKCTMKGPNNPNGYVFEFEGFSNMSGLFDYDCPFLMSSVCKDSYDYNVPFVSVYTVNTRKAGVLTTHFIGAIADPNSDNAIVWSLSPESLKAGTIKIGTDYESLTNLTEATVGFTALNVQTQFRYMYPDGVIIKDINNNFKLVISYPNKVQVTFSEDYAGMMCGVCSINPQEDGGPIVLTEDQEKKVSLNSAKSCFKKIPPTNTTLTTTPAIPVTTVIAASTTEPGDFITTTAGPIYPYCDSKFSDICDWLSRMCGASKEECMDRLCSGGIDECDYLTLGGFDSCIQDTSMTLFLESVGYCDSNCGINRRFNYINIYSQQTCSLPSTSDENLGSRYSFTCACDDGFMLSGNKCVRRQNCGCTLDSGIYKPRGATWRSKDCTKVYTCVGDNKIRIDDRPCGPNTECVSTDDGYACKCLEDFYGDPNMLSGCTPDEEEDETKICTTIETDEGVRKKECNCKMGYRSNCETCEDIDECKEGLNDCEKINEKCINKPGTYECDCANGFEANDGVCVDVDECREFSDNCKENEGCINEIGSFRCECCIGYEENPETGVCERNDAVSLPENAQCCVECPVPVLCDESYYRPVPYCYFKKDGSKKEYTSFKALYEDFCINNRKINNSQVSRGKCPKTNTPPPPTPTTDPGDKLEPLPPTCDSPNLCKSFPPPPPPLRTGPVCGPSNIQNPRTFPSYCDMLRFVCKGYGSPTNVPRQSSIEAKKGPCDEGEGGTGNPVPIPPKPSDPLFTDWSPWGLCRPNDKASDCGQGKQIRDRDVVPYDDLRPIRKALRYEIEESRVCFIPCYPGNNTGPNGLCPDISICDVRDPICGYVDADDIRNFDSECELNITACQEAKIPVKLNEGECDSDSKNKTRQCGVGGPLFTFEKFEQRTGTVHCVGEQVSVGSCKTLLCDSSLSHCCKPKEVSMISVTVSCYDTEGDSDEPIKEETLVYNSATECHCDTKTDEDN